MNPVILICSRRGSSRLPDKAFRPICGRSPIQHILHRVAGRGIKTVVCVPPDEATDYLQVTEGFDAELYFGNAHSPLHRMADYLKDYPGHDWVVRITHDDILIHWETVKAMLNMAAAANDNEGYICTPRIVEGAGVELIHADNLLSAAAARLDPTEFVSYYVKGPGLPRPESIELSVNATVDRPGYRLTMDYPEDATLLEVLLQRLGSNVTAPVVCAYLDSHSDLLALNRMPRLSFYTCVRNAEKWIGQAVSSVLREMPTDSEYVIVDDGSTDGTLEQICHFLPNPKIKVIANAENLGLASASNIAIKNCRGQFVMRVDGDDRLGYVGDIITLMYQARELDIVYPSYHTMDEGGNIVSMWEKPEAHHHIGGALVRKRMLDEIRFRDGLRHWDGLELYQRMKARGARIGYAPHCASWTYRVRAGSMSRSEPEARAALKTEITEGGKA